MRGMAVTARINNKKMLLLKPFSVSGLRCMSNLTRPFKGKPTGKEEEGPAEKAEQRWRTEEVWMPDPRTGIYFPRGQEWVMDDIPSGAASFDCTFWMRGIDGVDHHKQDNRDFAPILPSFKL